MEKTIKSNASLIWVRLTDAVVGAITCNMDLISQMYPTCWNSWLMMRSIMPMLKAKQYRAKRNFIKWLNEAF